MFDDGIPEEIKRFERAGKTACPDCGRVVTKGLPYTEEHDPVCASKAGQLDLGEWLAARRYVRLRQVQSRVQRLDERVARIEGVLG